MSVNAAYLLDYNAFTSATIPSISGDIKHFLGISVTPHPHVFFSCMYLE